MSRAAGLRCAAGRGAAASEAGQGTVEYVLIIGIIVMVLVGASMLLEHQTDLMGHAVKDKLNLFNVVHPNVNGWTPSAASPKPHDGLMPWES